jgi:hypothetical protein
MLDLRQHLIKIDAFFDYACMAQSKEVWESYVEFKKETKLKLMCAKCSRELNPDEFHWTESDFYNIKGKKQKKSLLGVHCKTHHEMKNFNLEVLEKERGHKYVGQSIMYFFADTPDGVAFWPPGWMLQWQKENE